jgi:hypothetical protein
MVSLPPNSFAYVKWGRYGNIRILKLEAGIATFVYGLDNGDLIGIGSHFTNETSEERLAQFIDFLRGFDFGPHGLQGCFMFGNKELDNDLAKRVTRSALKIAYDARGHGFKYYDAYRRDAPSKNIELDSDGMVTVNCPKYDNCLSICLR